MVGSTTYSIQDGIHAALDVLLQTANEVTLPAVKAGVHDVTFDVANNGDNICLPCPFKETEAISALKAVEAGTVVAIANLRYGEKRRKVAVDVERATCFLFAAYLSTIGGLGKQDPMVKSLLKGTTTHAVDHRQWHSSVSRYGSVASAVKWLPSTGGQSVPDSEP